MWNSVAKLVELYKGDQAVICSKLTTGEVTMLCP